MTTRLTNWTRDGIMNRAVDAAFDPQFVELAKQEDVIGRKLYASVFSTTELAKLKNVPERWLWKDSCLKFNIAGMRMTFNITEGLPIPARGHGCSELASISDEKLAAEARAYQDKKKELNDKKYSARSKIKALVRSVSTTKMLKEIWPEGSPYYEQLDEKVNLNLPAAPIAEINQLLGLTPI